MRRRHRRARSLLLPFRRSIAPVADPAKPLAAPEPLEVHRYLHSAKNADKVAASQRVSASDHAELPRRGGAIFPPSRATIHRGDRVCPVLQQHFPPPAFLRTRDKARSKPPAQACPLDLPARRWQTVCRLSW